MKRFAYAIGLPFGLLSQVACSAPTAAVPWSASTVYVASAQLPNIYRVDPVTGRVALARILPEPVEQLTLSRDRTTIYVSTLANLLAIDAGTLAERWREPLSTPNDTRPQRWGGAQVAAHAAIAVSSDGTRLYVAPAFVGDPFAAGTERVAVLDAHTRDLVALLGPFATDGRGLAVAPAGIAADSDLLLVAGGRDRRASTDTEWLYVVNPVTGAVRDSAGLAPVTAGVRRVLAPVVAPDGARAYAIAGAAGAAGVHRYELATRQSAPASPLRAGSRFALSPSGDAGYQLALDPVTGAPSLVILDAALVEQGHVALAADGTSLQVQELAVSRDGRTVLVTAVASAHGAGASSLLVIDVARRAVRSVIPLGFPLARQIVVP